LAASHLLAQCDRLARRGRSSDGSVEKRVARAGEVEVRPDAVIMNVGAVEEAGERLLDLARGAAASTD